MALAPFGPMSARPGSKNTSWSAGSSVNSSTLGGRAGAGVAAVEDGAPTGLGAGDAGDSAGGRCCWTAGGSEAGAGTDAVGGGAGGSFAACFCPHPESNTTKTAETMRCESRVVIDDLRVRSE